jgi:hypothetical protein
MEKTLKRAEKPGRMTKRTERIGDASCQRGECPQWLGTVR